MKNAPGMYLGVVSELLREHEFLQKSVFQMVMESVLCSSCFVHPLEWKFSNLAKELFRGNAYGTSIYGLDHE